MDAGALIRMPLFVVVFGTLWTISTASFASESCDEVTRPHVVDVYPSTSVVPQNLLRFYLYFDAAMDRESSRSQYFVRDEHGGVIDSVFLSTRFELWSEDARRLTLLLDPGRIKTGISGEGNSKNLLKPQHRFELIIGGALMSQAGCPLTDDFKHPFFVSQPDRISPNPNKWALELPLANSRESLSVKLQEPLDHVSLAYRIRVKTSSGASVRGGISLGREDRTWRFTPHELWMEGEYQLVVDPMLEDLAGNRPVGLFDDPTGESRTRQESAQPIVISFQVRSDRSQGPRPEE